MCILLLGNNNYFSLRNGLFFNGVVIPVVKQRVFTVDQRSLDAVGEQLNNKIVSEGPTEALAECCRDPLVRTR